jgi:hypothetical protein
MFEIPKVPTERDVPLIIQPSVPVHGNPESDHKAREQHALEVNKNFTYPWRLQRLRLDWARAVY